MKNIYSLLMDRETPELEPDKYSTKKVVEKKEHNPSKEDDLGLEKIAVDPEIAKMWMEDGCGKPC